MKVPVMVNPRPDTHLLIASMEFMGSNSLQITHDQEKYMSARSMGLDRSTTEAWFVSSHGRWCPADYI